MQHARLVSKVDADVKTKRASNSRAAHFGGRLNASLRGQPISLRYLRKAGEISGCRVLPNFRTGLKMLVDILLQRPVRHDRTLSLSLLLFSPENSGIHDRTRSRFSPSDASCHTANATHVIPHVHVLSMYTQATLHVFGFDFYASNATGRGHGFSGYYQDERTPEAGGGYHSSEEELRFFACLVRKGTVPVYFDENLARILRAREPVAAMRLRQEAHAATGTRLFTGWRGGEHFSDR